MDEFIQSSNFIVTDDRIILNGRVIKPNSIASEHVDKRVSAELIGLICAILVLLVAFVNSASNSVMLIFVTLIMILVGFGIFREITKPYVLVLNFYHLGRFEVRGLTRAEADGLLRKLESIRS